MTRFLLRFLSQGSSPTPSVKLRTAIGKLSGTVGTVCNLLLFCAKLTVGILYGSMSVTADALNNLSDAVSSVVTLVGFKLAEKPADADHPYGHARYEYLSGLAVVVMIIVIGVELARSSVGKIISPSPVVISDVLLIVLVLSVAVKLWLSYFYRSLGKQIGSKTLLATAVDSRNDVISTLTVLTAALLERFFHWKLDGVMGLGVGIFILYSGASLAKDTISPLLGETASPELRALILDVVRTDPLVMGYHDLMVHDYGPGQRFASIHVEMDGKLDPILCHGRIDRLERRCLEQHNVHLVIHYDPLITGNEELDRMQDTVTQILQKFDPRIGVHDFYMFHREGYTCLRFDVALPEDQMSCKEQINRHLDEELAAFGEGNYRTMVTFDFLEDA